jgi:hypothetical protein
MQFKCPMNSITFFIIEIINLRTILITLALGHIALRVETSFSSDSE